MLKGKAVVAAALGLALAGTASAQPARALRPDQQQFRGLFKELIETNTTLSAGSCTLAAERMAARLKAAGMPDSALTVFADPARPKEGGLVAVLAGRDPKAKAVLLLAHIDVVEAKREDWMRDPFTLVEEGGYFYGRGTYDDKSMAAIWVDTMARLAAGKVRPRRTLKLALTCGEETQGAFNGAEWLAKNRRELIDAEFALNEGGGGLTDGKGPSVGGRLLNLSVQLGEKANANFVLTATNPGGHSSQPVPDNAIYAMAEALLRIRDHAFPLAFNDTTRAYFAAAGKLRGGELGAAMVALAADPADKAADALVSRDKLLNAQLRTTCVATMVEGGHARNALPQRVTVNVNCRVLPGSGEAETKAGLVAAIGNPAIAIVQLPRPKPIAPPPPLTEAVIGPMRTLAAKHFPGVALLPVMATWATDGPFLGTVGIPTYGAPGLWQDPDANNMHGLNERIEVRALMEGRDFLDDLVRAYLQ